jgi:hypothetical protein
VKAGRPSFARALDPIEDQATAETGVSRGTRRETICETPSAPIVTP